MARIIPIKWFNGVVAEGLQKAGELVIEHRNELRELSEED